MDSPAGPPTPESPATYRGALNPNRETARDRPPAKPRAIPGAQIPIGSDLARYGSQVLAELLDRGPPPEPVAVVDAVNDQARLQDECVRDHRVVLRIGVLLDVEVLLHRAIGVGQERPLRADRRAQLLGGVVGVGRDRDHLRVGDRDLRIRTPPVHGAADAP